MKYHIAYRLWRGGGREEEGEVLEMRGGGGVNRDGLKKSSYGKIKLMSHFG